MALHVFRYGDTDIYALTYDQSGANLPVKKGAEWHFWESLDPVRFAWGAENFGEAAASLEREGLYLFEGEMISAEEAMACSTLQE